MQEAERLGRLLQEARAEAGLTQIEVAVRSGVPYSTLRAIERARVKEPCVFAVLNICNVIGIKPTKLASSKVGVPYLTHRPNRRMADRRLEMGQAVEVPEGLAQTQRHHVRSVTTVLLAVLRACSAARAARR